MSVSPVVVFAFNRPEHTQKTLAALAKNDLASQTELTVFCDGARSDEEQEKVQRVRDVVSGCTGFKSVRIVAREQNMGLARSVITGVTQLLEESSSAIFLEDDMITSPWFLSYMNQGLTTYANDERVVSVCGYTPTFRIPLPDTYFLPGAHCWGWGTWRRGWSLFEENPSTLLNEIVSRDLIYRFDVDGTEPLTILLQRAAQKHKGIDSWALRWLGSAIVHDKLTLYPAQSLVSNIGFDGTGTHKESTSALATTLADRPMRTDRVPIEVNWDAFSALREVLIRWRCEQAPRQRLYYALARWLPRSIERRVYVAKTRRWMGL